MKGRNITEQILLAQEMVHVLDKQTRGGQVIIKLDMAKAFDRVSWTYLQRIMQCMGMDARMVRIIINNLRSTSCSVLLNGSLTESFPIGRGVKQGDPLSPLLFILSSEGFSRGLNHLIRMGELKGFRAGRTHCISHLGFADDLLIFLNGHPRNLSKFRQYLDIYQQASGQLVNYHKSQFVVGQGTSLAQASTALGMRSTSLPLKYLGSYLYKGINEASYCSNLLAHFDAKLSSWSTSFLSMAGRLTLIKHVLNTLPTHLIASSRLPKSIIHTLHKRMASFLWKGRHHWQSWAAICQSCEAGGLGVRSLLHVQQAYDCQIWWIYFTSNNLWTAFCRSKYGHRPSIYSHIYDSSTWKRITRMHDFMEGHTTLTNGQLHWTPEENGQFSIRSAYNLISARLPKDEAKYIWWKNTHPRQKVFLWRLWHCSLPMVDNFSGWLTVYPSQCVFCRQSHDSPNHVFLHCPIIRPLWVDMSITFHGPMPSSRTIKCHLLRWWHRSSSGTMAGQLLAVVPSIVVWEIWKMYTSCRFGEESFDYGQLFLKVKSSIYIWCSSVNGKKFARNMPHLVAQHFSPPLRMKRATIVRWTLPLSGKLKLNVDAAVGKHMSAGAAILRTCQGSFHSALSFPLPLLSPLRAEIHALTIALMYYAQHHDSLIIETDCQSLLTLLANPECITGELRLDIARVSQFLILNSSTLQYCPREANMAPHKLARYGYHSPGLTRYSSVQALPCEVRGALYVDRHLPTLRL